MEVILYVIFLFGALFSILTVSWVIFGIVTLVARKINAKRYAANHPDILVVEGNIIELLGKYAGADRKKSTDYFRDALGFVYTAPSLTDEAKLYWLVYLKGLLKDPRANEDPLSVIKAWYVEFSNARYLQQNAE